MKILWYVNIIMPEVAARLNRKANENGSWILGQAPLLTQAGIRLHIVTVSSVVSETLTFSTESNDYTVIPAKGYTPDVFSKLINDVHPDLVHIFGTEYRYNTDFICYCAKNNIRHVVSIQGLMSSISQHYTDGLPQKQFCKINPLRLLMKKIFMADIIEHSRKEFYQQGLNEIEALKLAKNVIGRTHWDKDCVYNINPESRYFHVNENLRDAFYMQDHWNWENCKKHSIVISQGFYPVKGFHQFLPALAELKKEYPDVKVYVCGQSPFTTHNKILDYFVDFFFEYQKYIKKLIHRYNLKDCIEYKGFLNAAQMKELYLSANVFVSPSTIENGCISVGEAMMCGTPVVASNVGGVSTTLNFGRDGILYDFYDTDALVNGIKTFFDNKEISMEYSQKAILGAAIIYDRYENTQNMINAYKTIMED